MHRKDIIDMRSKQSILRPLKTFQWMLISWNNDSCMCTKADIVQPINYTSIPIEFKQAFLKSCSVYKQPGKYGKTQHTASPKEHRQSLLEFKLCWKKIYFRSKSTPMLVIVESSEDWIVSRKILLEVIKDQISQWVHSLKPQERNERSTRLHIMFIFKLERSIWKPHSWCYSLYITLTPLPSLVGVGWSLPLTCW